MAWGEVTNPARFGYGQSTSDDRNLFLKMFGGEVLAAFQERVLTLDKHQVKTVGAGKSFQFPKTWKATSEYHTAGQEMLGLDIDTTEVTITIDGLLVSHVAIYDLDQKMAHFDVTGEFSQELGRALARTFDKNVMRQIILAARTAADGPFPGGNTVVDASLVNTGVIDGKAWIDAIRAARIALFNKDVPEEGPFYMLVNANVYDAIKYAKDASGNYLVLNRDFSAQTALQSREAYLEIDGVQVYKQRTIPSTNETSDATVYSKYRANYSTTTGILWHPMAVATLKLIGIGMETERDVRRQEDFMVAKMAVGHGVLRAEAAVEFKTS
jgi:hypothetical protein